MSAPSGASLAFNQITDGENISATMVVAGSASIDVDPDNPGVIDATNIQTTPVSTAAPADGQVLQYSASAASIGYATVLYTIIAQSANYTANAFDDVWATGTITITSPPTQANNRFRVRNKGTGQITVAFSNSQPSAILASQNTAVEFVCDGTDWGIE